MIPRKPYENLKPVQLTEVDRRKIMNIRGSLKMQRIMEGVSLKEKKWLDAKVLVSDGTSGDVVTVGGRSNEWVYYCHICQFGNGIEEFAKHWESQEHQDRLKEPVHPVEQFLITQSSNTCFTSFGSQYNPGVSNFNERQQQTSQDTIAKLLISHNRFDEDEKKLLEEVSLRGKINVWQDYCNQAKQIEANLFNEMMYYKENPNEHQQYKTQWRQFCISNALYTNIDNEFQLFWELKLRDIFQEAFIKSKAQLRKKIKYLNGMDIVQSECTQQKVQDVSENLNSSFVEKRFENSDLSNKGEKSMSEATVIDVLRHLSVLEDQLGSLGPKVVDLLSKAILLEKSSNSSSLLFEGENCLLLETAKERLKGALQSGLIQQSLIGLVQSVRKDITYLINKVNSEKVIVSSQKSSSYEKPSRDYKSYDNENNSHLDKRKSFNENSLCYDDWDIFGDNKNCYRERKAYEEKNNYCPDERETDEDKKSFYQHKKKRCYEDDQKRITYDDHMSSSCNERETFYHEGPKIYGDETSSFHDGVKTFYRDKLKIYDSEMSCHDVRKIHDRPYEMGSFCNEGDTSKDKINFCYKKRLSGAARRRLRKEQAIAAGEPLPPHRKQGINKNRAMPVNFQRLEAKIIDCRMFKKYGNSK